MQAPQPVAPRRSRWGTSGRKWQFSTPPKFSRWSLLALAKVGLDEVGYSILFKHTRTAPWRNPTQMGRWPSARELLPLSRATNRVQLPRASLLRSV